MDPGPGAWDTLTRGVWHPSFPLSSITIDQVIVAVGKLRHQTAESSVDNSRVSAAGGQPSHRGSQSTEAALISLGSRPRRTADEPQQRRLNGAPRPPGMLKDVGPCCSTEPLAPCQLLEHWKQQEWYEGQVSRSEAVSG